MWCLRQEELLHLSIHKLTWQESNILQKLFEDV